MPFSASLTPESLLVESLDAVARIPEFSDRANTHLLTLQAMDGCGLRDSARRLAEDTLDLIFLVSDSREQFYLFRLLAVQQARMKQFDEAAYTFAFIPREDEQKTFAMREIAEIMASSGRLRRAMLLADRVSDLDDYEAILKAIAEFLLANKRPELAVQVAHRIEPSLAWVTLLFDIARCFFHRTSGQKSAPQTPPMQAQAAPGTAFQDKFDPMKGGADKTGDKAVAMIRNALPQIRRFPDPAERCRGLRLAVESYLETGRIFEAKTVLVDIHTPTERAAALCRLALALAEQEPGSAKPLLNDARVVAEKIDDSAHRAEALRRIARTLDEIGDRVDGTRVFREVSQIIREIRNPFQQADEAVKLARDLFESVRGDVAEEELHEALEIAEEIAESPLRRRLLGLIATAWMDADLPEEAEETLRQLDEAEAAFCGSFHANRKDRQREPAIMGAPYTAPLLTRLAAAFHRNAAPQAEVAALLAEAHHAARRFPAPHDRAAALREMAQALASGTQSGTAGRSETRERRDL